MEIICSSGTSVLGVKKGWFSESNETALAFYFLFPPSPPPLRPALTQTGLTQHSDSPISLLIINQDNEVLVRTIGQNNPNSHL